MQSVVVSNFTWDWIYQGYRPEIEQAPGFPVRCARPTQLATAAWRLPMHGGFESIARVIDVPFVARHARHGGPTFARCAVSRTTGAWRWCRSAATA